MLNPTTITASNFTLTHFIIQPGSRLINHLVAETIPGHVEVKSLAF